MKKFLALAVVAVCVLSLPLLAAEAKKADHQGPMWATGTITAWDTATKSMKMKDESGKEMSMNVSDKAQVHGTAKVGEMAKVAYRMHENTMMAMQVFVGKENMEKAGMDH
ncbi:MAG TPA: hypothetical protein VE404_05690 [Verrucomicrobiae bacterium]|nr:hypothetical protein [Verrucomicrobiae bacterium]